MENSLVSYSRTGLVPDNEDHDDDSVSETSEAFPSFKGINKGLYRTYRWFRTTHLPMFAVMICHQWRNPHRTRLKSASYRQDLCLWPCALVQLAWKTVAIILQRCYMDWKKLFILAWETKTRNHPHRDFANGIDQERRRKWQGKWLMSDSIAQHSVWKNAVLLSCFKTFCHPANAL